MSENLLTNEELEILYKFKQFFLNNLKQLESINVTEEKKRFFLIDTVLSVLESIRDTDASSIIYILQRLNKGENNVNPTNN